MREVRWLDSIVPGFVRWMLALLGLACGAASAAESRPPKLFLIGGSTLATFPETRPVVGWGQMLPQLFKDPAQVDNRGKSGRSTRSFIDQGLWEKVRTDLGPGDFLIIAFGGGNESKDDPRLAQGSQPCDCLFCTGEASLPAEIEQAVKQFEAALAAQGIIAIRL